METSAAPAITIGSSPGFTPRLLINDGAAKILLPTGPAAATSHSPEPTNCSARSTPADCSVVAEPAFRSR